MGGRVLSFYISVYTYIDENGSRLINMLVYRTVYTYNAEIELRTDRVMALNFILLW